MRRKICCAQLVCVNVSLVCVAGKQAVMLQARVPCLRRAWCLLFNWPTDGFVTSGMCPSTSAVTQTLQILLCVSGEHATCGARVCLCVCACWRPALSLYMAAVVLKKKAQEVFGLLVQPMGCAG
jgi:hypothetical protein